MNVCGWLFEAELGRHFMLPLQQLGHGHTRAGSATLFWVGFVEHAGSRWVKAQLLYHVLAFEFGLGSLVLGLNTNMVPGTCPARGSWASWLLRWPLVLMTGSPLPGFCFSTAPSAPLSQATYGKSPGTAAFGCQEGLERKWM